MNLMGASIRNMSRFGVPEKVFIREPSGHRLRSIPRLGSIPRFRGSCSPLFDYHAAFKMEY